LERFPTWKIVEIFFSHFTSLEIGRCIQKMIFVKIFIIFCCCTSADSAIHSQNQTSEEFLVSTAIADVCEEFFVKRSIKFDLIIYGKRTRHLDDVTNGVLRLIERNFSSTVQHVEDVDNWNHKIEDSALILFKNGSYFANFNFNAALTNLSPKIIKLIIHVENYDGIENVQFKNHYDSDKSHVSSFEYIVKNKDGKIQLDTFDNFQEYSCNEINLKFINFFNKTSQKWDKNLQNSQNFLNFNGCMLTLADIYTLNFHISDHNSKIIECMKTEIDKTVCLKLVVDILSKPDVNFHGLIFEIFEAMSKIGNFTANYQMNFDGYIVSKNKAFVNQMIQISKLTNHEMILKIFHLSTTFFDFKFTIFVTPFEFYSNFEKLLLPFDATTWILLLVTFLTIPIAIFITQFMSQKARIFIFGRGINTPGLNAIRIFFGIGQTRLPRESILRFILIFFVLFCLIMRTCYQSKMFEFITNDMRKPPPRTLDEVIEQGFTIVLMNDSVMYGELYDIIMKKSNT